MPSLSLHPSGITLTNLLRSSGKLAPISLPYAPVSSDVNQISQTPSLNDCLALAMMSSAKDITQMINKLSTYEDVIFMLFRISGKYVILLGYKLLNEKV